MEWASWWNGHLAVEWASCPFLRFGHLAVEWASCPFLRFGHLAVEWASCVELASCQFQYIFGRAGCPLYGSGNGKHCPP
ncbi:MAG: hypothetical protein F6K50_24355 [Moorea sp. SIO3I7]|uniref:hypothetical protein n=1 Tax=Moorena sp. SIO3I8 TaxID=2607833 RepID=UPI0013BF2982|nr:hypothetical protein [Moorena sp. SIO3I8]NEN98530.1 hypothetical protein [Moorena sp. SIO3I7]NEO04697.1 hypothetical protein [Moorena sp. SIO3I8]